MEANRHISPVPEPMLAVYEDMRGLARQFLSDQRPDHTLQPTALVHEAYLRMAEQTYIGDLRRPQLLRVAAKAMRHVLVDYARYRAITAQISKANGPAATAGTEPLDRPYPEAPPTAPIR